MRTDSKTPLKHGASPPELVKIDENIWELNTPLKLPGLRLDHRMTVIRLSSGNLVVHSPVEYSRSLQDTILELGRPRWFVAPSRFHDMFWPQWFGAFPQAQFVAVPGMRLERPELPFSEILGEKSNLWSREFVSVAIRGMPRLNEYAFLHPSSKTLLVADLLFNIDTDAQNVLGRLFLRANALYRKPGISRIFRAYIKDKVAFTDSLQEILSHDFDRIVIGHGANLKGSVLREAAQSAGFA